MNRAKRLQRWTIRIKWLHPGKSFECSSRNSVLVWKKNRSYIMKSYWIAKLWNLEFVKIMILIRILKLCNLSMSSSLDSEIRLKSFTFFIFEIYWKFIKKFKKKEDKTAYYKLCLFTMHIHKKLIFEIKKEFEMKIIERFFWKFKTVSVMNLSFSNSKNQFAILKEK